MTMSPDRGGVFDTLLTLVRRGLGGTSGDGRQYVSWVHHEDFTRAIRWLIAHDDVAGPVNVSAPEPLPNAAFMRGAARGLGHSHRPACHRLDARARGRSSSAPRPSSS